jgi:hypothetical protein
MKAMAPVLTREVGVNARKATVKSNMETVTFRTIILTPGHQLA